MDDNALLRYSRQIMLPDLDIAGQEKLLSAHVLVAGAGGLGSPVALYLAAAGVGTLTLADHDQVDLSNLQRQIAHTTDALGRDKALSARDRVLAINPEVTVHALTEKLSEANLADHLQGIDLVLDCTDNFVIRHALNDACFAHGVPLVSGAAIGWEGQVTVFDPRDPESPCYRCLHPEGDDAALNCAENGVIAPLVGIIGTCQAMEAVKVISGVGQPLVGTIQYLDAKYMQWRALKLRRQQNCRGCANR